MTTLLNNRFIYTARASLALCKEEIFSKSSAQVAVCGRHQSVGQNHCGLKPKRKKPYTLMGRFDKDEREIVLSTTKAASMTVNEYIRAQTLGPAYKPPEWIKALSATNRELTKQGSNLNQIAHKRNSNLIDEAETNSLLGVMVRSYLQTHKAVRDALAQGKGPMP